MKVIVLSEFRDINDFLVVHKVGDVIDVADERAAKLIELGLADSEKVAVKEPEKETKPSDFMLTTEEAPKSTRSKRNKE